MITVKLLAGKYRLMDDLDEVAVRLDTGRPVDGGGHDDEAKAIRQAGYLNAGFLRKQKQNGSGKPTA